MCTTAAMHEMITPDPPTTVTVGGTRDSLNLSDWRGSSTQGLPNTALTLFKCRILTVE